MRSGEASVPSDHCRVLPRSMLPVLLQGIVTNFLLTAVKVSSRRRCKHLENWRLADLWEAGARADTIGLARSTCKVRRGRLIGPLALLALSTMSAACASTGAVPRPFPTPRGASPAGTASPVDTASPTGTPSPAGTAPPPAAVNGDGSRSSADVYAVTGTALALRGAPYKNAGADPNGFDCSGFTWYVFAQHGITLPRDVRQQFQSGTPVAPDRLAPGDLVFFSTVARPVARGDFDRRRRVRSCAEFGGRRPRRASQFGLLVAAIGGRTAGR